jgi:hypothetical protein
MEQPSQICGIRLEFYAPIRIPVETSFYEAQHIQRVVGKLVNTPAADVVDESSTHQDSLVNPLLLVTLLLIPDLGSRIFHLNF